MEPIVAPPGPEGPCALAAATAQTPDDLAALLRDLRRRHARERRDGSLTYRELATKTGFSLTAIAEYFTGRTLPPADRFDALLGLLSATPAERRALAAARDRIEEANRGRSRRAAPVPAAPARAVPAPAVPAAGRRPLPGEVPRQLPAPPHTFTGRARELGYLDQVLEEQAQAGGALVVSVIGGMGGVGKTWLALHWAHRHLGRFPDGQLYVNLRGFDPAGQPLTAAAVVRGFLESLGVPPAVVPVEADAQQALYRSLAAGKRMLIVLDNARDTAQVAPLLPGGAVCTVVITSRRQLTGMIAADGARSLTLDVLSEPEARQLLVRQLGPARLAAGPEAAATLLACCAGLPLALSIVAARAAIHPHLPLATLAAELSDSAGRLDALDAGEPQADLRSVLSWSTCALSPGAARAFALLGIAPGPDIAQAAAPSLLALPPAATRALLRELDDAHLIQRHAPGRYRIHDLLRLHAIEEARARYAPAERAAAQRRLVDFYVHAACAATREHAPHGIAPALSEPAPGCAAQPLPDHGSVMAWFDSEHASLMAAQQLAQRQDWHAEACHLAWALDPYHRHRGHLADQATAWQRAVTGAKHLPDQAIRAQAHQMLGDACAQLGRTADALQHLSQALALAVRAGDIASQGEIHHSLGGAWERHGDDRRALMHAHHALVIFQALDDGFRQGRALNGVGWLQTRLGDYAKARANCQAALALLRQDASARGRFGESHTLDSLGYIAYCLREYDQALEYYDQALVICRADGHGLLEADVLDHVAEVHLAQRRPGQARDAWRKARDLYAAQYRPAKARQAQQRLDSLDENVGSPA